MTCRIHSLTVILKEDKREDDCEAIVQAILMVKGVGSVEKHVSDPASAMAEWRAKEEIERRLLEALRKPFIE